ncbi:mRNA cleavage and polyadenylation factor IA/II complex [Pseudomassariella vexata]|uniref:Polynucleotide 5'-hydroxyl-kinase GRC3 n=1 Tax=Pseudomassariella vexata TaxID=1141098 RepID=A0A1Y2DZU9_9PEZI|nr:mRNA cleavage and polyadenylation factor IA/II complex [Pseudomassariella vexata]ORY64801.1 mRNA cleavage and polyadenylation factor IA/II complex [Pseudomassariella vexata]
MSIPGLGIAPTAATPTAAPTSTATTTIVSLQPFWEWRFEVPVSSSLTIRLLSGTAEKDGTELAPSTPYTFSGAKSKINTWKGCELQVTAPTPDAYDAYTSKPTADETPMVSYLNLHMKLEGLRAAAAKAIGNGEGDMGPRILVAGPANTGKTSLVKMLAGWATRMGHQPMVVNTDAAQGMLSLPGTLSAAVFATIMDITTEWGGIPSSGPVATPIKLPLAYYYGLSSPDENLRLFKSLLSRLAVAATSRLAEDPDVKKTGMLIDTRTPNAAKGGYDLLAHIVAEFSVNIIIVLGSERMTAELVRRFSGQRTSLGECIHVVGLDKSGGVVERDAAFMQGAREATIREYFFGDVRRSLSPFTQSVAFDGVGIWRIMEAPTTATADSDDFYNVSSREQLLEKVEPSLMMVNCMLAVMYASVHDAPETIRDSNIMGFVYVADVDEKKKRLKVLAPVSAKLGDRPLLWGSYPEPMVSL